jgi:nucleotide-binding universal stress UspA family protein
MARCIAVPLDGSGLAESALPCAAALAKLFGEHLHIVRVHTPMTAYALPDGPTAVPELEWDSQVKTAARDWLERKAAELRTTLGVPVTYELRVGNAGQQIVEAAQDCDARAIACTTHGSGGWAPQWLGSVTDDLIRHAPMPVLAMSESAAACTAPGELRSILVLLDGSATAAAILPIVREMARASGAEVELFRVVPQHFAGGVLPELSQASHDRFGADAAAIEARIELDRVADDLRLSGLRATPTVEVAGNVTRAILDRIATTQPDLVAMCTHGRGFSRLFMGSIADKVLRAGGRPVLCWHPQRASIPDQEAERDFASAASSLPA